MKNHDEYACFLVTDPDNSNVTTAIKAWEDKAKASDDGRAALLKKYKPVGVVGIWAGSGVKGLLLKNGTPVPEGMRRDSKTRPGDNMYLAVPALKTVEGKMIRKEFSAIPQAPDGMDFSRLLGLDWIVRGNRLLMAWSDVQDGKRFVGIPRKIGPEDKPYGEPAVVPTGCELVGWSVYFKAKEDEAAKKEAVPA